MRAPFAALTCALLWLAFAAEAGAAPLQFEPCTGTPDYECAYLDVPLDPTGAASGALRLHVRRLTETRDGDEVLVALAGGPGQGSTDFIEDFAGVLAEGLENRQLVVLDTRGTGRSGALGCDALKNVSPAASARELLAPVGRCGRQLGESRRYYTTTEVVEDLEVLRAALEVPRISVFGISYGSYVAQRYARRFPAQVDRLVLDSPVAQDQGGAFDLSSYATVGRVLRELCAHGRCRGITRDPVADLKRLLGRFRAGPLRATVYNSRGRPRRLRLRAQAELFDLIVSSDFSTALRSALPAAIRSAAHGDGAPLLRLLAIDNGTNDPREFDEQNEDPEEFSNALFFATTCQEKPTPWDSPEAPVAGRRAKRAAAIADLPAGAFAPFGRAAADSTQLGTRFCERWPATDVAPVPEPGPIDAPALVLSGRTDLRTPLAEARRTAARISDASLVVVPGAGHSLVSSRIACVQTALTRFFAESAVGNPCAGSPARAVVQELAPLAPSDLRGIRGRGLAAKLTAAALLTLRDGGRVAATRGLLDAAFSFGGLRGGRVCARPGGAEASGRRPLVLVLGRATYVPGVSVSGRATVRGQRIVRASVTLSRGSSLLGTLRLRGRRITGRLGNRRISEDVVAGRLRVPQLIIAASLVPGGRIRCS